MTTSAVFQVIDPGPVIVATIEGEIDLANADAVLDEIMDAAVNDAEGLILDLSGLRYLDSTGIARLVEVHESERRKSAELQAAIRDRRGVISTVVLMAAIVVIAFVMVAKPGG